MDIQHQQRLSPTASPQRQANNQDPFAFFAPGPTMPMQNMTTAPPAHTASPAPLQPQMNSYVAPPMHQIPVYSAPAPMQQPIYTAPPVAFITPPVRQQPVMQMPTSQPPAMPQAPHLMQTSFAAPPISEVFADPQNKAPDSPIGDVSAILQPEQPTLPAPPMPMMQPSAVNPFDFEPVSSSMPSAKPMAPPPAAMPPNAPPSPTNQTGTFSPPMSPVYPLSPQVASDPFGYCFSPLTSPVSGGSDALVPMSSPVADPFGVFGGQHPPVMPSIASQAIVPSAAQNNYDPFGIFGGQQPPAPESAPIPAAVARQNDNPYGIFGALDNAPTTPVDDMDPWAAAGFGQAPTSNGTESAPSVVDNAQQSTSKEEEAPLSLDSNGLPNHGEYYEARVSSRSLGVMFYTAREVKNSLLQKVPRNMIEAMGSRPIVSYVAGNSAAYNAGINLGHTVLEVNGVKVEDAKHCADLIRTTPRPLNIRCFNTNFEVVLSENKHLVKYDTLDMEAPKCSNEWKMKYVVVGGIVANPWTVNMYYSKKDYDTAVKETHAREKVSVKIKQFDLRGAKIIVRSKDGKPNWIHYPGESAPWHYFTILPRRGYPIKISSPSLDELEPVYRAVTSYIKTEIQMKHDNAERMGHYIPQESIYQTVSDTPLRGTGKVRTNKDSYW